MVWKALRTRIIGSQIGLSALGIPLSNASLATASAAGCRDSLCNGRSSVSMGCDRAAVSLNSVVFEDHASGGTFGRQFVTLRYSPRCRASWSRVTASAGGAAAVRRTPPSSTGMPRRQSAQQTARGSSLRRCDREGKGVRHYQLQRQRCHRNPLLQRSIDACQRQNLLRRLRFLALTQWLGFVSVRHGTSRT
jgi:Protein of unknown function (DUF2690)